MDYTAEKIDLQALVQLQCSREKWVVFTQFLYSELVLQPLKGKILMKF